MKRIGILVNNAAIRDPRVIKTAEGLAARGFWVKIFCRSSSEAHDIEIKNGVFYERDNRKRTVVKNKQIISAKEEKAWRKKSVLFVFTKVYKKIIRINLEKGYNFARQFMRPAFLLCFRILRKLARVTANHTPKFIKKAFLLTSKLISPIVNLLMILFFFCFVLIVKFSQLVALVLSVAISAPKVLIVVGLFKAENSFFLQYEMGVYKFIKTIMSSITDSRTHEILANVEYNMLERVTREKLDLVLANDIDTVTVAEKWAMESGGSFIVDLHELQSARPGRNSGIERRAVIDVEKRVLPKAAKVYTVSPGIAEWYESKYAIKTPGLLLNLPSDVIDVEVTNKIKVDLGLDENSVLFVYVGNLTTSRGIEKVLDALVLCPANVHYAILGPRINQHAENLVHERINKLNIADRVHLIDPVPHHMVVNYISDADWGIIPAEALTLNQKYGLPNKLFEMMFAGLPILCVDIKERREFINEYGYCLTSPSYNATDLSSTMIKAINDTDAKEIALNRKFEARELLSLSKMHDKLSEDINYILTS